MSAEGNIGHREHRVHEQQSILADHKFLVEALLPDLHIVSSFSIELLVIPEFPQARCAIRLDSAGGLQRGQVVLAQILTMDLKSTDVEGASIPVKRFLRVELQNRLRQAIVLGASVDAARYVTERLAGFYKTQRSTVFA